MVRKMEKRKVQTPRSQQKKLAITQQQARIRILMLMKEGISLGGKPVERNSLHEDKH